MGHYRLFNWPDFDCIRDPCQSNIDILCKFRRKRDEKQRNIGIKAQKLQLLMEMNLATVVTILKKGRKEKRKNTKKIKTQKNARKRKKKKRKNEAKRTKICEE